VSWCGYVFLFKKYLMYSSYDARQNELKAELN